MAGRISQKVGNAGYQDFWPYAYNLSAFAQKGGFTQDKFTCVGLMEWSSELVWELNYGQGFIPNALEDFNLFAGSNIPVILTPELLHDYVVRQREVQKWIENSVNAAGDAVEAIGDFADDTAEAIGDFADDAVDTVEDAATEVGDAISNGARYVRGFFDPVDFIITDPQGRRLGYTATLGELNEIPGAIYTGDGYYENFVIFDPLPGQYDIQLFGLGERALAAIGDELGGFLFDQFLDSGDSTSASFTLLPGLGQGHTVKGGLGNETLGGSKGEDVLDGKAGNDLLNSGEGNDEIYGGVRSDTLQSESGDDFLRGGIGLDLIDGGNDSDTVDYSSSTSRVIVNIDENSNYSHVYDPNPVDLEISFNAPSGLAQDGFSYVDSLKRLESINGSSFDDILIGNSQDNYIRGNAGDDLLIARQGDDTFDDGAGTDVVSYRRDPGGVSINLSGNKATDGFGRADKLFGLENVIGSNFNDSIIGDGANNVIIAGFGSDLVFALGGDDVVYGEVGQDTINGGDASDTLYGNSEADWIHGDSGRDLIFGNTGNDNLWGDDDSDTISGNTGDDFISGGAQDDLLYGNEGNDLIQGDAGQDEIVTIQGAGARVVS